MTVRPTHPDTRRRTRVAVLLLAGALAAGCGGYGEVSPYAYQCATALYTACNQQDQQQLGTLDGLVDAARENGEISKQEAKWLSGIIARADEGQWDAAMKQARRMMEDQVKRRS